MSANSIRYVVTTDPEGGWAYGANPGPYAKFHVANDATYCIYNNRLMPVTQKIGREDGYWLLRRKAGLFDTGERPIEIAGPDAEALCNRVFTRDVSKLKPGRAGYGLLCYPDGKLLCDGVLLRHDRDRFWYVQADGPVYSWLVAHAQGLDVAISDPRSWVAQVQGPASLHILDALLDGGAPAGFSYYSVAPAAVKGQKIIVSRTGWTNELGFEFYTLPDEPGYDPDALWTAVLEAGAAHGLGLCGLDSMEIRRIEGGILNNGSDFDETMTPYEAGLGRFVDLSKPAFVGREALLSGGAPSRLIGLIAEGGEPLREGVVSVAGARIGTVTAAAYSPFLDAGVAIVRLDTATPAGSAVEVEGRDGRRRTAVLSELPLYDRDRAIPRGVSADIPERPKARRGEDGAPSSPPVRLAG
ncbi:aminomethyltransferase family protein [Methylopila musalis]|uniref:Aminomethyltransferase family protein n=1 Tax=Methylopila musalis TaxID=1134781 RepID=A0ABW3Z686_9HYPH